MAARMHVLRWVWLLFPASNCLWDTIGIYRSHLSGRIGLPRSTAGRRKRDVFRRFEFNSHGLAGSPHADSTLRGQPKALARIVRRLPPQEGCRPLVHPLRSALVQGSCSADIPQV
jgi:hypothetical protein